ncbi:hypothetical protein OF83DRAFT_1138586 [Amylostereum chailletii]|nr:hypothetical protein OF83DRAFT_1138586 [Amylostereum chailletii]
MADVDIPPFIPPDDDLDDPAEEAATVHLLQPPPRKRARTREVEPKLEPPEENMSGQPVHDKEFYLSDGSCILQVGHTLFNVHRTMLSRDSSFFGDMFSLPQGEATHLEGSTDSNPIHLHGDTVSEFKNFLWVLYALPHELTTLLVEGDPSHLPRLIDIARVANKYSFRSLEKWSLDVIVATISRKTSPPTAFSSSSSASPYGPPPSHADVCSNEQIVVLVRLAQLCNHGPLLDTMVTTLRKLLTSNIKNAYLALSLADELDLHALRGAAYLEVMQKATVVAIQPRHEQEGLQYGDIDDNDRLIVSRMQQLRLLSGYYRLSCAWDEIRAQPVPFEHAQSCGLNWHQGGCVQSWLEFWRDKTKCDSVMALGLADALGRLKAVLREFDKWGSATLMHHDCRVQARRAISERLKVVQESLSDYFADDL